MGVPGRGMCGPRKCCCHRPERSPRCVRVYALLFWQLGAYIRPVWARVARQTVEVSAPAAARSLVQLTPSPPAADTPWSRRTSRGADRPPRKGRWALLRRCWSAVARWGAGIARGPVRARRSGPAGHASEARLERRASCCVAVRCMSSDVRGGVARQAMLKNCICCTLVPRSLARSLLNRASGRCSSLARAITVCLDVFLFASSRTPECLWTSS
ncbi:hypothetical protein PYCCODRAFT_702515 [Trametes coccinea BRFM310]|uniref:Uncharacterized protein n=1 Tax=Trametes coccinea (strain BRFM310) TaxID=1353009 RepID=A0A1Y2IIM4_TRAC3|nr:hypothetical protein PYCCODRAFT_702515 [Trametes coccinea BRFM310]